MMTTAERRVLETKAIFETVTALPQTGSKAYGLPNPKDDDRYCDPKTFKDLKDTLDKAEIPYSRKSSREGGIQLVLNEIVFNIWPVHEAYLQTYAFATDALKGVARGNGIEWLLDKRFRVQLFRIILATCDIKINKPGLTP